MSASTTKKYHREIMRRSRAAKRLTTAELREATMPEELVERFNQQHDARYGFRTDTGFTGFGHLSAYRPAHPLGHRATIEEIWLWHRSKETTR